MMKIAIGMLLTALAFTVTACGGDDDEEGDPIQPGASIRAGVWQGTLPSAPAGSGTLSFRVNSATSLTFLATRVPTFNSQTGCASTWNHQVTIGGDRSFTTTLSTGNTAISITGAFNTDSEATGTITGTCNGALVLLGQTFRAAWSSN